MRSASAKSGLARMFDAPSSNLRAPRLLAFEAAATEHDGVHETGGRTGSFSSRISSTISARMATRLLPPNSVFR